MSRLVVVDEEEALADLLAEWLAEGAGAAREVERPFSILLSGGSIATAFFPRLAQVPLDWSRVSFWWADERAVPIDHPDSSYRLAYELWLEPARVPESSVHRMPADVEDLERAAADYERDLIGATGDPSRPSMALLGVGEDGHVASLFPCHSLLGEEERLVAAVTDAPKLPRRRLTLTLPALAGASLVVLAAFGKPKSRAIAAALEDPTSQLPAAVLLRRAKLALVLLDQLAASALSRQA